ncbi:hypothetical protein R5R35_008498 [Gryllus longicercus]|uniref:Uncharacterized protein n=1 Tax=Gryllus longicercus TaxID=2509291 RepID=A0AAN9Z374_9ORTH
MGGGKLWQFSESMHFVAAKKWKSADAVLEVLNHEEMRTLSDSRDGSPREAHCGEYCVSPPRPIWVPPLVGMHWSNDSISTNDSSDSEDLYELFFPSKISRRLKNADTRSLPNIYDYEEFSCDADDYRNTSSMPHLQLWEWNLHSQFKDGDYIANSYNTNASDEAANTTDEDTLQKLKRTVSLPDLRKLSIIQMILQVRSDYADATSSRASSLQSVAAMTVSVELSSISGESVPDVSNADVKSSCERSGEDNVAEEPPRGNFLTRIRRRVRRALRGRRVLREDEDEDDDEGGRVGCFQFLKRLF